MVQDSEPRNQQSPHDTGERRRRAVLAHSAAVISLALLVALFYGNVFYQKRAWFLVGAVLIPSLQTVLSLIHFESIRASQPNIVFELLLLLSIFAVTILFFLARASSRVLLVILCLCMVCGRMFDTVLGLATVSMIPSFRIYYYITFAVLLPTLKVEVEEQHMAVWLAVVTYLLPAFLGVGLILISAKYEKSYLIPADPVPEIEVVQAGTV